MAHRLPLADPLDFAPFAAWRARAERTRHWTKRVTDAAARGQPPLKDKFQATFQMTLLGSAFLSRLWESQKYRVLPFSGGKGESEVIAVYPGATLRALGLENYKSEPREAVRVSMAACAARGIELEVDPRLIDVCCRYSSGKADYDAADAFVALCTAILHAEKACIPATVPDPIGQVMQEEEGAIWVPSISTVERT